MKAKTILLIALVALFMACKEQPADRADYVPYSNTIKFYTLAITADTVDISYSDNIVGVSVSVPAGASDSTLISGTSVTFDGFVSTHYAVAPGEYVSIGYDNLTRVHELRIIAQDEARIILSPIKE